MSLTSIKELAVTEYDSFLTMIYDEYPELILKYPINHSMKSDFIEAVLRQVWVKKPFDKLDILKFMTDRRKR